MADLDYYDHVKRKFQENQMKSEFEKTNLNDCLAICLFGS